METIIMYLNNMFASLPRNEQTLRLKQNILSNMEEKYYELKNEGKSENEAVGIVISEFGNIDELVSELGIGSEPAGNTEPLPLLTEEEAESFMVAKRRSGLLIGLGVALCMTGVAQLILITTLAGEGILGKSFSEDTGGLIGVIMMFLLLVPAIGMFIYSGRKMEQFSYLESGVELPYHLKAPIRQKQAAFASTYTLSLIMGVCLCVLSPVAIFAGAAFDSDSYSAYGVVVLLLMIALAVFLFVYYGSIRDSYNMLAGTEEFATTREKRKSNKEEEKVIGAVAAIVWPLATCIFLVGGLVFQQWQIIWIVFPITGILFGMFSAAYNILKENKQS